MSNENQTEQATEESEAREEVPEGYVQRERFEAELSEAAKRRDRATQRAREAEARARELEAQLLEFRKGKAESKGTDEQVRLFKEELQKREAQLERVTGQLKTTVLENQVKSKLPQYTKHVDDAWALLRSEIEAEEDPDSGGIIPIVKANPYRSIDDHLNDFFKSKPFLADNPRKQGGGVPKKADVETASGSYDFEDLKAMAPEKRLQHLRKDRKLAEAWTAHQLSEAKRG